MAPSNDPVKFVEEAIVEHQKRVLNFYKSVWKRVKSYLTPLQKFLKNVLSAAKDLAQTVGKKVISQLTDTIRAILNFLSPIEKLLKDIIQLGKRILATIRKKADKNEVIRFLKTVVRKYVETFTKIVGLITDLWKELGILDAVLAVFNKFRLVLSMAFGWFDQVTGVLTAIGKVRKQLQKAMKSLLKERKEALRLVKDVAKLKVP
ncbi:hypothetical protein [Parasedimentitalea huanghaiensis]|uniref:Uncharacterized protein n=1 Tax=Parasedimentitalea huanghaiensis TaxID=2682100 RepID=A0A6L6WNW1_9RHOB|nr:hypothetical protein [Zongyanglinia huanghaiensis]MVO18355.1 hypothetical protein [Zongyanglinia huanghaiensis]